MMERHPPLGLVEVWRVEGYELEVKICLGSRPCVCRRGLGAPQWWVVILLPVSNKKQCPNPTAKLVFWKLTAGGKE